MKKKYLVIGMGFILSLGLCSCGKEKDDDTTETTATTEVTTVETTEVTTEVLDVTTEDGDSTSNSTNHTSNTTSNTTSNATSSTTSNTASSSSTTTEATVANDGPYVEDELAVVEIVNAKGEETTVYHLADGDFMDRVSMRFKYDGNGTWTDENGVEWSRAVK